VGLGPQTPEGGLNSPIQVWPNPFSSDVSIALIDGHTSTATFTITSSTGQVVYQQQETNLAPGYTKMLELSYLPNGVYFVEVSTEQGKYVQRIVKE
jgi:ribosomal protein L2